MFKWKNSLQCAASTWFLSLREVAKKGIRVVGALMFVVLFATGCPEPPTAAFTATPTTGFAPLNVNFTDSSDSGKSAILTWVWDFGDSETSQDQNPTHLYSDPGTYTVTLTVTNSAGAGSERKVYYIEVQEKPHFVRYVSPGGSGDGVSWDNAFGSIQDAVDAVSSIGQGEVWVAAGTYVGATPAPTSSSTDEYVVVMAENVAIYGGFAGHEVSRNDRDWVSNPTIIDGESVRHCVCGMSNATLDGFTIQNGYPNSGSSGGGMINWTSSPTVVNCTFTNNHAIFGGAMCNEYSSSPTVTNCTFSANIAAYGVAMYNYGHSSPEVSNCTFTGNTTTTVSCGGGMYNESDSSPKVTTCTFANNIATYGAGMYNKDSSPVITDCVFDENKNGGMYNLNSSPTVTTCRFNKNLNHAGMTNEQSSPTVNACTFTENLNGGVSDFSHASLTITGCTFSKNHDGGIRNDRSSATVSQCTFEENEGLNGAGVCSGNSGYPNEPVCSIKINACTFLKNTASGSQGGGMGFSSGVLAIVNRCQFTENTIPNGYGGGMACIYDCQATISECTFKMNSAYCGGGLACETIEQSTISECTFSSNSAYQGGGLIFSSSTTTFSGCVFSENTAFLGGNDFYDTYEK